MADGTVRGVFDLDTGRAVRGVRDYRREAAAADAQTRQLGSTIDRAFGESQVRQIDRVGSATQRLARDTFTTRREVRDSWRGMRRDVEREAAGIVSTIAVVRDRMRALGRERATPQVNVDGIAQALAQVELLHSRLNSLGRERVTPRVALGGGFGGGGGAGGAVRGAAGGGGSAALRLGNIGFAGIRGGTLLAGAALGLPAVQAVGGAGVALGGSLGAGALGAGAAGLGGLAPLVAGIAGVMSVAKPAQAALKDAWQQQDRLTKAVQEYGRNSKQARVEAERLNRMTQGRPGIRYATTQARGFANDWRRLTRPGQRDYYGLLGDVSQIGRRAAPQLAQDANLAMSATRRSGTKFTRFLAGDESQSNLAFFTRTFARELPTVERTFENVTITVERLARSAVPFFHEGNVWVEKQTEGWRRSTRNIEHTRDRMRPLVQSAKDWAHLTGTTFDLLRDLGHLGQPSGDSMVMSLDRTFTRWDDWIQHNPDRTRKFFSESVTSVDKMASGLSSAVGYLHQLADVLRPILDRFSELVGVLSSLGLIGTPGALGALYGGYRGLRGGGGRGGGGGGVGPGGAIVAGGLAARLAGGRRADPTGRPGLAGRRAYGDEFRYGAPVSQLGRRPTMFGRGVNQFGRVAGGALGAYLPVAGAFAALDIVGGQGSFGQRATRAASDVTFGRIPAPTDPAIGRQRAGTFLGDLDPFGSARDRQAQIQREIARVGNRPISTHTGFLGLGGHTSISAGSLRPGDMAGARQTVRFLRGQGTDTAKHTADQLVALMNASRDAARAVREESRERRRSLDDLSRQRAVQYAGGLGGAFHVYRKAGQTRQQAGENVVEGIRGRLSRMRDAGVETLGEASLGWARAMAKRYPEMKQQVDDLNDAIEARFRRMGKRVHIVNGDILTGSKSEWKQIRDAMGSASEQAREKVSADFTAIQQKAIGSLRSMGFSGGDARRLVATMEKGGRAGAVASGTAGAGLTPSQARATGSSPSRLANRPRARGGTVPGQGTLDTVQMGGAMVAPGETWIANRHTMADLSRATTAMYGLTAQQIIRGETRRHSAPTRFARGGVTPAMGNLIERLSGKGFHVGSTTTGTHAPHSYHYRGQAADYGDASNDMHRLWSVLFPQRRRFAELFGPSYLTPRPTLMHYGAGFADPALQAQHNNHIHVALAGGGVGALGNAAGAGGYPHIRLRGVGRRQAGVPGVLRSRAGDIYARGLQRKINSALDQMGGGGGDLAGFSGGGDSNANMRLGHRMMLAAGWGEDQWGPLRALWSKESGWNATARNPTSGAFGIPQSLPASKMGAAAVGGDAAAQIRWGLGYIRGRYGSPAGAWAHEQSHNWYARGGKLDWGGGFARGGSMVTNGPTAFVAGEGHRRRERVTVTPANSPLGGGRVNLTIAPGAVVVKIDGVKSDQDIDRMAKRVGEKVVGEIVRALDRPEGLDD